jgi:uncharacterized protein
MKRKAMDDLLAWKNSMNRLPLVLRGPRQVGKTWLMKEFGKSAYEECAYINMEGNQQMQMLFEPDLDVSRILVGLRLQSGCRIEPGKTLVIFDEVQEVPKALTSLKYFRENLSQYHIMAAGSMLGIALHPDTSFPVGKVDIYDLHPLDFFEFLKAMGKGDLVDVMHQGDWGMVSTFRNDLSLLLRQYMFLGGMPEVAAGFAENRDFNNARKIQKRILSSYEQDFSKHAPNETVPRIRMLWESMPSQLSRENRKFVYGLVRQGARAREYELAMTWLNDCGLVRKVNRVSKPGLPLRAYEDAGAFKLFLSDVGLLAAMAGLDARTLLDGDRVFEEFKGALTEQYVLQQLLANGNIQVFYWSSERGSSELDFVVQADSSVVPIEVKAAENLKAKSMKIFRDKFSPGICVRTSMSDFRDEGWLVNIPLYGIGAFPFAGN